MWGLSILYIYTVHIFFPLSPYTNITPNPIPYRKLVHFHFLNLCDSWAFWKMRDVLISHVHTVKISCHTYYVSSCYKHTPTCWCHGHTRKKKKDERARERAQGVTECILSCLFWRPLQYVVILHCVLKTINSSTHTQTLFERAQHTLTFSL